MTIIVASLPNMGHYTGTERWFRHPLSGHNYSYTEGVQYVAEQAGAYWLVDKVLTTIGFLEKPKLKDEDMLAWHLMVDGSKAVLAVEDGNGKELWREKIEYTDFPAPGITLWWMRADGVLCLPSEY